MNIQRARKTLEDAFQVNNKIYEYICDGKKDKAEKCISIVWRKIAELSEDGHFRMYSPKLMDTIERLFKVKKSDPQVTRELHGILVLLLNYYEVIEYSSGYHPNNADNSVLYQKRLKNGKLKKIKV